MTDGALSFVSWVRRGLATAMQATEGGVPAGPFAVAELTLGFNENPELEANPRLPLIGPGDIVGLDSRVLVRLWPKPEDLDAEFDPYVLLEMDQADLPWRYTPAKASGTVESENDRLRPWFSLVVLEASEGSVTPPTPSRKIAVLTVSEVSALPSASDLWAFAHTQFEGQDVTEEQAKEKISGAPGLFTARLMSSRLLRPNTEYMAYLVPTFERGRLVGLGRLTDEPNTDALAGWNTAETPFELPVYFHWRFRTGSVGSFKQAARLIRPFVLPESIGRRDMDVSDPGGQTYELPSAASGSLPVEGALLSVTAAEQGQPEWPPAERDAFLTKLRDILNAPADADAELPVLAPPLYGQWYAAQQRLDEPTNPPWFHELNSDPRNRVGAALGTKVIQNEQQALLAAGWEQVEEIRDINALLRQAQLARGLSARIFVRHFTSVDEQLFYQLTVRVHALVTCGDKTVCKRVQESPIVPGFLSAQWLRWSRPLGPLGHVQGRPGLGFISNLLRQLNDCRDPAPEPEPPDGRHNPGSYPVPGGVPCHWVDELIGLGSSVTLSWGLVILWVARRLLVEKNGDCWWIGIKALRYAISLIYISIDGEDMKRRCRLRMGTLTVQDILNSAPMPSFVGFPSLPSPLPRPTLPGGGPDSPQAAAVRTGLAALLQALQVVPQELECGEHVDLDHCRLHLETELHPHVTVGRRITSRIAIDADVDWDPVDPLEPVLYVPEFERPMYEPLNQISSDWILPGLNQIKRDSIGLAVTNQRFIEAYMAGLNQEMTRELLWNEFPTDQRGTYFRQFWSIAGHILEDGSALHPELLRDIRPLRLWEKTTALGDHSPRPKAGTGGDEALLVLVVRAQLIQKYPNVIVYAQQLNSSTQELTGEQRHPVFYALIEPDVAFYGFQMTAEEIRNDPSWYFVLQEQPGDPKFTDRQTTRSSSTHHTILTSSFGESAGRVAEATFMQPFRLGIQAATLLPPSP